MCEFQVLFDEINNSTKSIVPRSFVNNIKCIY